MGYLNTIELGGIGARCIRSALAASHWLLALRSTGAAYMTYLLCIEGMLRLLDIAGAACSLLGPTSL